jgi:sugar lactone lactonase YvrE
MEYSLKITALVFIVLMASLPARSQAPAATPREVKLAVGPDLGYAAVPEALPLPPDMHYASVAAVAINSAGHIFVFQRAPVPLIEFDGKGNFIRAFGEGLAARPHGMRIDSQDNIWITDVLDNTVMKLNPQGQIVMTLGKRGPAGEWNEAEGSRLFNQPVDVAFGANGDVFVAQGHGGPDPRVFRFDKNGRLITQWSGKVEGSGAFTFPHTIALDPQGDVYIGDRMAKQILVFDPNGRYKRTIHNDNLVCGFYVGKDRQLYMTSGFDGQIEKLDWDGHILGVTGGGPGKGVGQYGEAHYMAMDSDGSLYIADTQNNRVQKLVKKDLNQRP